MGKIRLFPTPWDPSAAVQNWHATGEVLPKALPAGEGNPGRVEDTLSYSKKCKVARAMHEGFLVFAFVLGN